MTTYKANTLLAIISLHPQSTFFVFLVSGMKSKIVLVLIPFVYFSSCLLCFVPLLYLPLLSSLLPFPPSLIPISPPSLPFSSLERSNNSCQVKKLNFILSPFLFQAVNSKSFLVLFFRLKSDKHKKGR